MDKQTLEALEFSKIIENLHNLAKTPCGKILCGSVTPLNSPSEISSALLDTYEMQEFIKIQGELPLSGIIDIQPSLNKLSAQNAFLTPQEFSLLSSTISAMELIKKSLLPQPARYPRTSLKINELSFYDELMAAMAKTFDEKGCIKDSASPELSWLRQEISSTRNRARNILNELLRRQDLKPAFQDDFITIRDDRFCLALKSDFKGKIKGIIHSESSSGETYFIEPFETVELNNQLTMLAMEERDEEIRILKNLSNLVRDRGDDITKDISIIAEIDVIHAKAKLGIMLDSIKPEVNVNGGMNILDARHPILALEDRAVPVFIHLEEDKRIFVISGANTGGKTVALKTLGLLALMVQSGFTIPAGEGSCINIFDNVIADIGDRQDIALSLSTFSGHLKRLGEIMRDAGKNTLVLIDEICDGTDPVEAGALSIAILERLKELEATTVVTTHLNTLKSFAYTNGFAKNISVEFDKVTLKPTYKLLYGIPGESCAITIAEKWGIEGDVIKKAREYLKGTEGAGIEFIRTLEDEKRLLMDERQKIEELNREAIQINERRKKAVDRFDEERRRLIDRERKKAEEIIRQAEEEMKRLIEETEASGKWQVARQELEEIKTKTLEAFKTDKNKALYVPKIGDAVSILGRQNRGRIINIDEDAKEAEVLIGSIKVKVKFESIEKIEGHGSWVMGHRSSEKTIKSLHDRPPEPCPNEINIIGLTIDDALPMLDRFIDSALLNSMTSVVIIHGVGTGRLRNAVHEYLKKHRAVKGFQYADLKQGGSGATVVEL